MGRSAVISLVLAVLVLGGAGVLVWRNRAQLAWMTADSAGSPATRQASPSTRQARQSSRKVKLVSTRPADLPPTPDALSKVLPLDAAKWIMDWQTHELAGRGATDDELHALHEMLLAEKVDPIAMCGLLRTIDFLDGHDASQHIFRIVVDKTTAELNSHTPPDEAEAPLIAAMWPLHDMFNDMQAHDVDKELVGALRNWETYASPDSQKVNYIYGEILYENGDYNDAVTVYENLQKERAAATEPSTYINRPLDWDLALCLNGAGRYAEAADHFALASQDHGAYSRSAAISVPIMLYRAGKKDEAIAKFKEVTAAYELTPKEIDDLAHSMQGN